jgi:hypothetical protein
MKPLIREHVEISERAQHGLPASSFDSRVESEECSVIRGEGYGSERTKKSLLSLGIDGNEWFEIVASVYESRCRMALGVHRSVFNVSLCPGLSFVPALNSLVVLPPLSFKIPRLRHILIIHFL